MFLSTIFDSSKGSIPPCLVCQFLSFISLQSIVQPPIVQSLDAHTRPILTTSRKSFSPFGSFFVCKQATSEDKYRDAKMNASKKLLKASLRFSKRAMMSLVLPMFSRCLLQCLLRCCLLFQFLSDAFPEHKRRIYQQHKHVRERESQCCEYLDKQ